MAQNQKSYDNEFKAQAVKLAQEIGAHKAANELGIPKSTMYTEGGPAARRKPQYHHQEQPDLEGLS